MLKLKERSSSTMDETEINNITPNKDNDKKLRDTIKPSEQKTDGPLEESTTTSGKLQYFTE